jgi:hypothetical protein
MDKFSTYRKTIIILETNEVIDLPKNSKKRPDRLFSAAYLLKVNSWLKHQGKKLVDNAKPYLVPKYWTVYLLAFGLGLYLWGPSHGLQKISQWKIRQEHQTNKNSSVETLRHELNRLKQQLRTEQAKKVEPVFDAHSFSRPALGQVVQGFEWTGFQKSWRLHPGIDISLPAGSNIMAAAAGTIIKIEKSPGGFFSVTLDHGNGWESVYADLNNIQVQDGQKVIKGVIIGTSSSTGTHLKTPGFHFGIYHHRQPVDPKNIIEGL